MNKYLTRIKNSFVENIHSLPNLSYPICHFNVGVLTMDPENFQTLLNSDFIFFQPVRIHMININNLEQISASAIGKNSTIYFIRETWHLCNSAWITHSNFLLYLIWYFWCQDIKFKNSTKNKIAKKKAAALGICGIVGRNKIHFKKLWKSSAFLGLNSNVTVLIQIQLSVLLSMY